MVQDVNKFGKRPADDDGEVSSAKRRLSVRATGTGLYRFAKSSLPASDMGAVQDRYQQFVQSSLALRGAIEFQEFFQNRSSSGAYAKESERCAAEFHRTLPGVLADTRSLDSDQQRLVIEMACNTEEVADVGKALNLACKHIDDFKATPRAILLLNGIRSLADIQPDARNELLGHLSNAIDKGYLGKVHFDALNAGRPGRPAAISESLSLLAEKLAPEAAAESDSKQLASSTSPRGPKLDDMPPEILQNILLHAIEPDLRKNGLQGLEKVLKTADAIGLTSKHLRENADKLRLPAFSKDSKEAISIASDRYGAFLMASDKLFAMENDGNVTGDDPRYLEALKNASSATTKVFPVIKLMGEPEQSKMISTFCKFRHAEDITSLMASASEYTDDFFPKPRSEMLTNLIHLLPHFAEIQGLQQRAYDRLAKAEIAGQLDRGHYNALAIAELDEPGLRRDIAERIANFRGEALHSPATVEPEMHPIIPGDSVGNEIVKNIVQARQSLLQKVDDRAFSR